MALNYTQVNPFTFAEPTSPHIVSAEEGRPITGDALSAGLRELETLAEWVLVEGAGGWFTPLSATLSFADWVRDERLPVILVVGIKLGCINHALLTARRYVRPGCRWWAGLQTTSSRRVNAMRNIWRPSTIDLRPRCWARSHGWRTRRDVRISASIWISARWIGRHPLCQQRFIQLDNAALRHITPAMQQAKTVRHPANKRQVLFRQQHR